MISRQGELADHSGLGSASDLQEVDVLNSSGSSVNPLFEKLTLRG